jgi:hypothetical protein
LALAYFVVPVFAAKPLDVPRGDPAGHLYLFEKDPFDWTIVDDGMWGKMTYHDEKFVFNGHSLVPGEGYMLINYARDGTEWPPTIVCLGYGETNNGGNVNIQGAWTPADYLPDTTPGEAGEGFYKFWLVPGSMEDCEGPTWPGGWSPTEYLFEATLVEF